MLIPALAVYATIYRYTVFKLSSGAYFKYSSGGTPVLLFALGYGTEGKNDVGESYTFVMGDKKALPVAATVGMVGMREGGTNLHTFCRAFPSQHNVVRSRQHLGAAILTL